MIFTTYLLLLVFATTLAVEKKSNLLGTDVTRVSLRRCSGVFTEISSLKMSGIYTRRQTKCHVPGN